MKFNKNNIENLILIISAVAIMIVMPGASSDKKNLQFDSSIVLILAIVLVIITAIIYVMLIVKRVNPKKNIYFSYALSDKEMAIKILEGLERQFKKLSKYHYEIIAADSISYGSDMQSAMRDNISKSELVIILVSPAYLQSEWCLKEFEEITNLNKHIIPIITESFADLKKLPNDISNIKALSLRNCKSQNDLDKAILKLARDLIKQRKEQEEHETNFRRIEPYKRKGTKHRGKAHRRI